MKHGKTIFQFVVLMLFLGGLFLGCKSRTSNQPSNPFALNRQTAPPPATFSHQAAYLGQMPSAYVPQLPAATYPAGTGDSIPANRQLPAGTAPAVPNNTVPNGNYGSINNSGGATLFQTSATIPATVTENDWTATETTLPNNIPIAISATGETVFQNLESKSHSVTTIDNTGIIKTTVAEPETFAVSSSQLVTPIVGDSVPETAPAQPNSVYAGKYQ
ncbi:MAG: hypothetical protein LBQ50_09175 [Planctomycetaceae bacterium]|jgi:hypothetical protein|nr:hypothetical protein [Planctomycetaceae bacterium]